MYPAAMPSGLERWHGRHDLHFMTFTVRALKLIACVLLLCCVLAAQQQHASAPSRVDLPFSASKPLAVPAPNGKLVLWTNGRERARSTSGNESELEYFIESAGRRLSPPIRMYNSPSAMWSPASDLLAVTSSDGGLVGSWKVFVYEVLGGRVVEHNIMKQVQADLARAYPGGINPPGLSFFSDAERRQFARDVNWVNVLACRWIHDPQRLLVNAQVPPSSGYGANMSKSIAYVIDPRSGRIFHTYTEQESERLWKECGGN